MRIAFVVNSLSVGGAELLTVALARRLSECGHDVMIYAVMRMPDNIVKDSMKKRLGVDSKIILSEGPHVSLRKIKGFSDTIACLRARLKEFEAEVIHTHCEFPDLIGALASRGMRVRRFRTSHNEVYYQLNRTFGLVAENVMNCLGGYSRVICISNRTKKNNGWLVGKKTHVIYNGVFSVVPPPTTKKADGFFHVGIVGRVSPQKGQIEFIQKLRERYSKPEQMPFHLHLYGSGTGDLAIQEITSGFESRIHGHGIELEQNKLYEGLDLVIIPSLFEGMSSVMLEAVGRGIGFVSFPVSGADDIVAQFGAGLIVKNARELIDALEARSFPKVEVSTAKTICDVFSLQRFCVEHEKLYAAC